MFPDFLVIGAQKAGTTWLHRSLQAHPQIWTPRQKELHYFDEKINLKGGTWSRLFGDRIADARWRRQLKARLGRFPKDWSPAELLWDLKYFFKTPNDDWYASLFRPGGSKVKGETTPDYSVLERETIAHIHDLMPEAKIIFMMRNPIERLWSAMDMRLRSYGSSFEEVRARKLHRQFNKRRMRLRTDYLRTLENWGSFYPEERFFVGFLEDVHFFPEQLTKDLYSFLDVDPTFEYRGASRKVHSGSQSTMSTKAAVRLASSYHSELGELAGCFGGYATFWLDCAERLIEDPPADKFIPYPLWESSLWEEWDGSREIALQSGPLSSVWTPP